MRRVVLRIGLAFLALLLAIQLRQPDRTNPPVDPSQTLERHAVVPADVKAVLDRACRDCHSHVTRWPFYAYVAPISWDLAEHVRHGREHMNFSEWGRYDEDTTSDMLIEICRRIRKGDMPLPSYRRMHRDATLTQAEVDRICDWTKDARRSLSP